MSGKNKPEPDDSVYRVRHISRSAWEGGISSLPGLTPSMGAPPRADAFDDVAADMAMTGEIPLELIREALSLQEERSAEAEAGAEPEIEAEPEVEIDFTDPDPAAVPVAADARPKYAGWFGKIVFAPCNAWFLAGAWAEKNGIPAILALGTVIAMLALKY